MIEASAAAYTGIIAFEGGAGEDSAELRLPDGGGTYTLATSDPVKPRFELTAGGARHIVSAGLETLQVTGGDLADLLTVSAGAAEFGGILIYDGGAGDDRLTGPDKLAYWQINALNGGWFKVAPFDDFRFENVENLTGGSQVDAFNFSGGGSLDGAVDGGGGAEELDLGFVYLKGSLTITRQVADITLTDGTTVLDDAVFYTVTVTDAEVFVGSGRGTDGAIGVQGTIGAGGGLALTIVSSGTATYFAVRAVNLNVALTGVGGITLDTGLLSVDFNSKDAAGRSLDFTKYNEDADPEFEVFDAVAGPIDRIDFATAARSASATDATIDLFGLVGGTVSVSFSEELVDLLDLDGDGDTAEAALEGASMLLFALDITELHLGGGDFLIRVTDGTIGLAAISAPVPSAADALDGVIDSRRWIAVTSRDLAVELTLPGFSVVVDQASFSINTASGQYLPAPAQPTGPDPAPLPVPELAVALDWADADGTGGFAVDVGRDGSADLVDPGAQLGLTDLAIVHHVASIAIAGHLEGDLFDFLHISADFAYAKSSVAVDLDPDDDANAGNPESAELITFGLTLTGTAGDPGLLIGDAEGVHFEVVSGAARRGHGRGGRHGGGPGLDGDQGRARAAPSSPAWTTSTSSSRRSPSS